MRSVSLALALLLLVPIAVFSQTGTIGIYSDNTGTNCNITDAAPGLLSVYVVHVNTGGATACWYMARKPICTSATYLTDTSPFGMVIGNSQTGVSVAYGACLTGTIHVQTIVYFGAGTTPSCCEYPVLADPLSPLGAITVADCDFNELPAPGLSGMINPDVSCPCGEYPPSVPHDPSPPNGAVNQPLATELSWLCEDAEGDPLLFDVYFGTDAIPPLVAVGQPTNRFSPGSLSYNTTYYWKIMAKNLSGGSATGPVWRFRTVGAPPASLLTVSSVSDYCGPLMRDTVVVNISIQDNANPIDAAGLDLTYDPAVLTYIMCTPGNLTSGWDYFGGSDRGNYIRVGGFDLTPIPVGRSGRFARVYFLSNICSAETGGEVTLCPQNLTDDLVSLTPVCGKYSYEKYYANGDVNDDGNVTPGDALCAFKGYLTFPSPPDTSGECGSPGWDVRSDVNCSHDITPADALCIFEHWLDDSCPFCIDWTMLKDPITEPVTQAVVSFSVVSGRDGAITVPVRVSRVPELKAFGFELTYPADQMEFVGLMRLAATVDMDQLDTKVVEPGRVRVGGYTVRALRASSPTDLLELRFRSSVEELSGAMTIESFVDHFYGAKTVTRVLGSDGGDGTGPEIRLFQNHPNPFNPVTAITYEIPANAGEIPVTLVVYNVEGKRVRTLVNTEQPSGIYRVEWDGRNEQGEPASSGVYFYALKAGSEVVKKKMLLLK